METPKHPTLHEPRRAVTVMGTLMPHLSPERHHVYRNATALALLAALIAAGFGSLSIALVLAAVALPAVVMTYIHDHGLWHDEPITVVLGTFLLSLVLGVGVGFLETYFLPRVTVASSTYHLPPAAQILELGVLVPVVAFVALLIAPMLVTARPAFRHPMDVVVTCSLSGAALSLGLSVVVQHGAFTHLQATAGQPANVAFIALTLGFLQPIVFATAAATAVLGLRSTGVNPATNVLEGLVLVLLYELATTLLQPYGARGIVLTALVAFLLAGAGLLAARGAMHTALAADTGPAPHAGPVHHRLHGAAVAAIIAVVVLVAAIVTAGVVFSGPSTQPTPPNPAPAGGIVPTTKKAASWRARIGPPGSGPVSKVMLAAGSASTIDFGNGVTLTVAPGWTIYNQGQGWVNLNSADNTAEMFATVGKANASDVSQLSGALISDDIKTLGMTNVQQDPQPPINVQG
ncbi:MAG TPA: zinc ribbon domain-containing protein, partial [Mycobacterium sp.]|nr:zinc ribbon domain-containing protein [Mycobacterium sp.]